MGAFREIWLMDNGSLRPDAAFWLRCLAEGLSEHLRFPVRPVSLLHSSGIDPAELDGQPAEIIEPALKRRLADGVHDFAILPLFFGPSGALTDYLPKRIRKLRRDFPALEVAIAPPLAEGQGAGLLTGMLADHVRATLATAALAQPWVVLVDHGSPARAVAAVRDDLARRLGRRLSDAVAGVRAASMERREGDEYAFNEPLLAQALREVPADGRPIVVAMLFLLPGRHAGEGGDVPTICAEAAAETGRSIIMTSLVGEHPGLFGLLVARGRALLAERDA